MSSAARIHDLLDRLGHLARAELRGKGQAEGMPPVQLEALAYLCRCNRYSDTPQAVAQYLGLTKGTVSQSLKRLENNGLLSKSVDADDRRVVRLTPTDAGRRLIEDAVPPVSLQRAIESLAEDSRDALTHALNDLLTALQHDHGLRPFGICRSCRFHTVNDGRFCGLTGEPLSDREADQLCREHEYPVP